MTKDLNYYLKLPYTTILRADEDGDLVAEIEELPGCVAHGSTQEEALQHLAAAKEAWIADCIEAGHPVPEPIPEEVLPSGRWVQRVPRGLHLKLTRLAKREGASLNQLVTSILAEAVGFRNAEPYEQASAPPMLYDLVHRSATRMHAKLGLAQNWTIKQPPMPGEHEKPGVADAIDWLIGLNKDMKIKMVDPRVRWKRELTHGK
jgi:antitoxin HicB